MAVGSRGGVSVLGGCFRGAVARQEGLASVASVTEINPPEGGYLAQALQAVISIHIGRQLPGALEDLGRRPGWAEIK